MDRVDQILTPSDLAALIESAKQLASEVDLDVLLESILVKAGHLMDSPEGAIFLKDPQQDGLYFAAATGGKAAMLLQEWGVKSSKRVPMQSKAGVVFSSGKSIVVDSVEADPGHFKGVDRETSIKTTSMVCAPLAVADPKAGRLISIGAIQILNKRTGNYSAKDQVLLEHFASQAAVAIRNAQLFRDMLSHMGLYSTQDAMELLARLNSPAHLERLTIMFADMRGFTQLSQVLSPERLQKVLNAFLGMLTDQVLEAGGVVNKFLGDGLLAFFSEQDGPRRAVNSALAILQKFEALRSAWDNEYNQDLSFLDIGIGIATDAVIVGAMGSTRVRDFTTIGVAVNLAAAFEKAARGGKRLLVDQETWKELNDLPVEADGPLSFELRKPDQEVGIKYKMYSLNPPQPSKSAPRTTGKDVRVFLCHASEDKVAVRDLYKRLSADGFEPWLDEERLLPGQDFHEEIKKAVKTSQIVLVCLSSNSVTKEGYIQREIRYVLDVADEKPEGAIYIIPVRLMACKVHERLSKLQWVDLFEQKGYQRLLKSLRLKAEALQKGQGED